MRSHLLLTFSFLVLFFSGFVSGQTLKLEKERHRNMLSGIKEDIKKNYYDPQFKGRDIETDYKLAVKKIESATSIGQLSGIIAQFLIDFDDSHLFYIPPGKTHRADYGFDLRMIGDKPLVIKVAQDSDASKKGLKVGDEIYALNNYAPSRTNLWIMRYLFFRLRPQPVLALDVINPDGQRAQLEIIPKIDSRKRVTDLTGSDLDNFIREAENEYVEATTQWTLNFPDQVFIWKMPSFSIDPHKVDEIMDKARGFPAIIFDLRGNGGGRVDMIQRLVGNVFDREIKIGDEKKRKEAKELIAKSRGKDAFSGKVVVLIDSASASASEVFSRVVQIENRGTVIGDRSAGAVMESRVFGRRSGMDIVVFYGASITIADLIMKDGKSLEKTGVTPDIQIVPTASDLAGRRDVVMAKALETVGVRVTPETAGSLFPNDDGKK